MVNKWFTKVVLGHMGSVGSISVYNGFNLFHEKIHYLTAGFWICAQFHNKKVHEGSLKTHINFTGFAGVYFSVSY